MPDLNDLDARLKKVEHNLDYFIRMTPGIDSGTGGWEGEKLTLRELVIIGALTAEDLIATDDLTVSDLATITNLTITTMNMTGNQAWQTTGFTYNGAWATSGTAGYAMRWRVMPWGQVIIQGATINDNLNATPIVLTMPVAARPATNTQIIYGRANASGTVVGNVQTNGQLGFTGVVGDTVVEFPYLTYFLVG